jgi:hypothetical protein
MLFEGDVQVLYSVVLRVADQKISVLSASLHELHWR